MQILVERLIRKGAGFKKSFQVVHGLIARGVSVGQEPNELLLVSSSPVAFDDRGLYRFHRFAYLRSFLEHLELGQLRESHPLYVHHEFFRNDPNLQISVTHPYRSFCRSSEPRKSIPHPASRIPHPASRIPHPLAWPHFFVAPRAKGVDTLAFAPKATDPDRERPGPGRTRF